MSEVSFISFPSQLSIYSPNDLAEKRNGEGISAGRPVCSIAFPDISVDGGEKTRKVWWTDKCLRSYLSKICNKICQKTTSGSWEALSKMRTCDMSPLEECNPVVRLQRTGTVLCSGVSPKQKARQHWHYTTWKQTHIGCIKEEMRGLMSVRCHIFVSETWCKDQTIWQTHSVTYTVCCHSKILLLDSLVVLLISSALIFGIM